MRHIPGGRFWPLLIPTLLSGMAAPARGVTETDLARPDGGVATPVQVELYVADVQDVSASDQTFLADVVMRAEWQDPRLAGRWPTLHGVDLDAVWHPRLTLVNQRGTSPSLPQRVDVDPSGRVVYRQRWSGRFSTRMDLRAFPMDHQHFGVQAVCLGYPPSEVELVSPARAGRTGRADSLTITDWKFGPARMETANFVIAPGVPPLAGVQLAWEGARQFRYYGVQLVLPLVMIVLMGWTALWVEPTVVTTRMGTAVTTMLTLIAYRFAFGTLVPRLTYLTRFDYFTWTATLLVFLLLLVLAAGAYLVGNGRRDLVARLDRWARALYPLLFFGICVVIARM